MDTAVVLILTVALEVLVRRWGLGEAFAPFHKYDDASCAPKVMPTGALILLALGSGPPGRPGSGGR